MYTLIYSISKEKNPKTVYVNLTNSCTNSCIFCLRSQKDDVCGSNMWHDDNYNVNDVIKQFEQYKPTPEEVVFCGYGEPFLKKDIMKSFAEYLRKNYPAVKIRINTNGHANAVYKKNVAEEFKDLVDEISVSLNSDNSEQYNKICQPHINNAYEEVKSFLRACNDAGIKTVASIVTEFDENIIINEEKCKEIAKSLGSEFKNRKFISNGY